MKIEQQILFKLLGDYYLHATTPSKHEIAVANEVGAMLHKHGSSISTNIQSLRLTYGNKYQLHLGYISLEQGNPLLFSIDGQEVASALIVSPYDGRVYELELIAQQMQERRHNKRLVYYIMDDEHHIGSLAGAILHGLHGSRADVARTIIMLRPHNRRMMEDVTSALLGAPLAYDNETIVQKTDTHIITNKNIYAIEHATRFEKPVGHKLIMFEPVYNLVRIDIDDAQHAAKIVALIERASWSNALYAQKLLRVLLHCYFVIQLPIDVASENSEAVQVISSVFKNTSVFDGGAMTFIESDEIVQPFATEANMLTSSSQFRATESHRLYPTFFHINEEAVVEEQATHGTTTKGTLSAHDEHSVQAQQSISEQHDTAESWIPQHNIQDSMQATEQDERFGTREKPVLVNTITKALYGTETSDSIELFSDTIESLQANEELFSIVATEQLATYRFFNEAISVGDRLSVIHLAQALMDTATVSTPHTTVAHEEVAGSLVAQESSFSIAVDAMLTTDSLQTSTVAIEAFPTKENAAPVTVSSSSEEMELVETEAVTSIASDVLIVRDEMEVDTDTTIDEM